MLNIRSNSPQCTNHCNEIITDVADYINCSIEDENFILAVIDLKEHVKFSDFMINKINRNRRGEYRRAIREGYYTKILSTEERNERRDELFAINTSTDERQGKMSEEYSQYPPKEVACSCPFHFHKTYAVFAPDGVWIGYIYARFCGEIVRTYRILGHAGYMGKINFMILLMFDVIKDLMETHSNTKYLMYHLMYAGKQGLQDWKKHAGFKPVRFVGETIT